MELKIKIEDLYRAVLKQSIEEEDYEKCVLIRDYLESLSTEERKKFIDINVDIEDF